MMRAFEKTQRGLQVSNGIYFVVVTVCAPIWEEAIFRGFLLPSLTRYMPVNAAVLVSALGFAGADASCCLNMVIRLYVYNAYPSMRI